MAKLNLEQFRRSAMSSVSGKSRQGIFNNPSVKNISISIDELVLSPFRVRLSSAHIPTLIASMAEFGQLEAIAVAKNRDGYEILNGHGRVRALRELNADSVDATILRIEEEEIALMPYILNNADSFENIEVVYYIERLLREAKVGSQRIAQTLFLDVDGYKLLPCSYNLFDLIVEKPQFNYEVIKAVNELNGGKLQCKAMKHLMKKENSIEDSLAYIRSLG